MWRDIDPRTPEPERAERSRGGRAGGQELPDDLDDPRSALTRDLDLPRGSTRERVRLMGREYRLSGSDVRTLAAVGGFRVVPASDLRELTEAEAGRRPASLEHLRQAGLIRTQPYVVGRQRTTLVTLTERGRALLEESRRQRSGQPSQAFYAGISKPRELAHDSRVYRAYLRAAERLAERGARVRRVVLEEELKRAYQGFLQSRNRGRGDADGRPETDRYAIERWAAQHELPCHDGHVQFPDLRIEYEERDGRRAIEDVEVVTPHYRGALAAAKARAGFTRYRAVGARVGGWTHTGRSGGGPDPRLAEELLS